MSEITTEQLAAKDDEIMELRSALSFYAKPETYETQLDSFGSGMMVMPIMQDKGSIAKKILS